MALSARRYTVVGFAPDFHKVEISIDQLFEDDGTELLYTLQEDLDKILDLQKFEVMHVGLSRDNENMKGVIKRVS